MLALKIISQMTDVICAGHVSLPLTLAELLWQTFNHGLSIYTTSANASSKGNWTFNSVMLLSM